MALCQAHRRRPEPAPDAPLPGGFTRSQLLGRVVEHYAKRLRTSSEAWEYLAGRGLGAPELLDAFRVGYADGSLLATLPEQGELRDARPSSACCGTARSTSTAAL